MVPNGGNLQQYCDNNVAMYGVHQVLEISRGTLCKARDCLTTNFNYPCYSLTPFRPQGNVSSHLLPYIPETKATIPKHQEGVDPVPIDIDMDTAMSQEDLGSRCTKVTYIHIYIFLRQLICQTFPLTMDAKIPSE